MGKDARLSFRISDHLSERVDKAIDGSGGQIRDRSEFGTKAVKFYLDYIENTKSEEELILEAIVALAKSVGEKGAEVSEIKEILSDRNMIPSILSSRKDPETHPDFEKLLGLFEQLSPDSEMRKELGTKMMDMAYNEVADIYKDYSDAFFLGKARSRSKITV